jgi:hypothetical protein
MTVDQLAKRIFEHAKKYAESRKVRLGDGADQDFAKYAQIAAAELLKTSDAPLAGREKAIDIVFERVIDEMLVQAKTIPGYERGVIGEQTLKFALSKLCPLFPFC